MGRIKTAATLRNSSAVYFYYFLRERGNWISINFPTRKKKKKVDSIIFCYRAIKLLFLSLLLFLFPLNGIIPDNKFFLTIILLPEYLDHVYNEGSFEFLIGFWYFKSNQAVSNIHVL